MFASTTALAALATTYNDTGTMITYIVGVILVGLVALLGLGFGIRHLRKYISGRKF